MAIKLIRLDYVGDPVEKARGLVIVPTPAGNNSEGVSWVACVAQSPVEPPTDVNEYLGVLSTAEQTALTNGTSVARIIMTQGRLHKTSTATGRSLRNELQSRAAVYETNIPNEIQRIYRHWGGTVERA